MSTRTRGELITRIAVVAYCAQAAGLRSLAERIGSSAALRLAAATDSPARLAEIALRAAQTVVVARLGDDDLDMTELLAQCEGMPVVLLLPGARALALQALRAGAAAVLEPDAGAEQITAAVLGAAHGLQVMPAGAQSESAAGSTGEALTPREAEVLSLLAAGDSNKAIAARLAISVHTVKFHIASIFAKLGVGSRTEAVALGLRLGIVLL